MGTGQTESGEYVIEGLKMHYWAPLGKHLFSPDFQSRDNESGSIPKTEIESIYLPGSSVPRLMISI